MLKRTFDILFSIFLISLLFLPTIIVAVLVRVTSRGDILYWSERVGRENINFMMPKFRTMRVDTPQLATHLLNDSRSYLTPIGNILRKTSLDEIPQLYSILKGEMSFVGPRPALFNQHDLNEMRTNAGVHKLKPGLTGWAQINGRDDISCEDKVKFDLEYLEKKSFVFDMRIMALTLVKVLKSEGVKH